MQQPPLYSPQKMKEEEKTAFSSNQQKKERQGNVQTSPSRITTFPTYFPSSPPILPNLSFFSVAEIYIPPPPHASGRPYLLYAGNGLSPHVSQLCRSMTSFFFFGRKCNSYFLFSLFSLSRSFPFLPFSSAISSRPLHPPSNSPAPPPPE